MSLNKYKALRKVIVFSGLIFLTHSGSLFSQVGNDDPCSALPLTVGTSCSFITATTAGATTTPGFPNPGCANYSGGEVWFSVTVPASGNLDFDSNTGVITDGGMAVYSGSCNALTLLTCDDDNSVNGLMPMISLNGLTPGSTIYIAFWEYGNDSPGTFDICVTEPPPPGPPTAQDCPGAISICQNVYSTTQSYSGEGNLPQEINNMTSCLGSGELNDVWYVFTVQSAGDVNFSITPNSSLDDYDWAVYNLTSNNCSDIFNNPALEVSCNYSGNIGCNGVTGANNQQNGACGGQNEPAIPVQAGETYVVNVSNFSSSQSGYTLDFGQSTASIFDQSPPSISSFSTPSCNGGSVINISFSENVDCSSIQPGDFTFSGPGGPYTITGISSTLCSGGATYDNQFSITISPAVTNPGSYTLNLTGSITDICGNQATTSSFTTNISPLVLALSSTPPACGQSNGTITANVTTGVGPYTYSWNPGVSTGTSASGLGAGNYIVTVTDAGTGCTTSDTVNFTVTTSLAIVVSSSDTICPGASSTISVTPNSGTAPYTYNWNNGLPNQATQTVSPGSTTIYTVSVTDQMGCTSGTDTITLYVPPPLSASVSANDTICQGETTTLTGSGTGGDGNYTYTWNNGLPAGAQVPATPNSTTTYSLTVTDGCGSTANISQTITVIPVPVVQFTADTLQGCQPLTVNFSAISTGNSSSTYSWDFGDGSTGTGINSNHSFTSSGCFDVILTVGTGNCVDSDTSVCMIDIFPQADAGFTANPQVTDILNPTVFFTDQSSNADSWWWSFGDNSFSNSQNISHTYDAVGTFNVILAVTNSSGCPDTVSLTVIIEDYYTLYVPNAFTPNGDLLNDIFYVYSTGISTEGFELLIFDRWGNQVYKTTDPAEGWNGSVNNDKKTVEIDTYVYKLTFQDNKDKKHKMIGHINVIK